LALPILVTRPIAGVWADRDRKRTMPLENLAAAVFGPGAVTAFPADIPFLFYVGQLFNPYLLQVEDKAFLDQLAERAAAKSANL
jgi:hypothetical protein